MIPKKRYKYKEREFTLTDGDCSVPSEVRMEGTDTVAYISALDTPDWEPFGIMVSSNREFFDVASTPVKAVNAACDVLINDADKRARAAAFHKAACEALSEHLSTLDDA